MNAGAIVTTIVGWLIFIGALWFSFSRIRTGKSKWED